jgi:hypothetical protein
MQASCDACIANAGRKARTSEVLLVGYIAEQSREPEHSKTRQLKSTSSVRARLRQAILYRRDVDGLVVLTLVLN